MAKVLRKTEGTRVPPALRADRHGYVLGEESVDGFADRPELDDEDRLQLARWARRFASEELSEEQRRLLARADASPRHINERLLDAVIKDAEEDSEATSALGFYQELTNEQLELVRNPARHPAVEGRGYPLSMRDMKTITGASERQLRYWQMLGLLPAYRVNGQRRFLSAALARAFVLKEVQRHEVAALAALARGGPEAARFIRILGATLGSVAGELRGEPRRRIAEAAETMVESSKALTSGLHEGAVLAWSQSPIRSSGAATRKHARAPRKRRSTERHVIASARGGWSVKLDPKGRASSRHATKQEAVRAAQAFVARQGGGTIRIHSKTGSTQVREVKRSPRTSTWRRRAPGDRQTSKAKRRSEAT